MSDQQYYSVWDTSDVATTANGLRLIPARHRLFNALIMLKVDRSSGAAKPYTGDASAADCFVALRLV
jgi:hypothetical protein